MRTYQVAVVGAGPAGSTTAALLARRGYDVLLVDRAEFPRDKACAEYCSPGVAEILARTGTWDLVAPHAKRVSGMTVYVGGRVVLPIRYSKAGVRRAAFTIPRTRLDDILAGRAVAAGADLTSGARVTGVVRRGGGFDLSGRLRSGADASWRAGVVVGADGLHSAVSTSLGVASWSHWPRRLGLITHYEGHAELWDGGEMHVGKGLYCGLAPLPGGLLNAGLVINLGRPTVRRYGAKEVFAVALEMLPGLQERLEGAARVKPLRGLGPMTRTVDAVAGQGFLLVGDAAGFLDPFTGEGIYRALRGAELAAQVIDDRLRDGRMHGRGFPDLRGYADLRTRDFRAKERLTWIIQLALTRPALFSSICSNLSRSPETLQVMGNILGDFAPPQDLLRPSRVLDIFRPRLPSGIA